MHQSMATITRARPESAGELTALALRSKAYWGYDADLVEACREALTVDPEEVERYPYFTLAEDGLAIGFYGLTPLATAVELSLLFVEPDRIGKGHGRRLFEHAVATASGLGARYLVLQSDPNAEGFYLAMGAERLGTLPSPVRNEGRLTIMRYVLPSQDSQPS